MEIFEKITKTQEEVRDVVCDCCGNSCKVDSYTDLEGNIRNQFEFLYLYSKWGYHSNKDCQTWEAHVCEKCVDEKLGFIKFKKTEYL